MKTYLNVKVVLLLCTLFYIFGCGTAQPVMAPSGKMGFSIECNGTALSMTACYEKAAEVCPNGYTLISQNENRNGIHKGIFVDCK